MRALDILIRKRDGHPLTPEEIRFLIDGYVAGSIPDYQVSALLMAIRFQGMSAEETGHLTQAMIDSGDTIDLSALGRTTVDKHSTGGVGDKVSLILAPLAAACGLSVPMMSGRALGHTGGTLDKLDSIPGYTTALDAQRFAAVIAECGFAMTGQSERIVPADRLLYALRDVTGTVESIPLITSSILSKKFAEGADALVFDVKSGPGAFMKTRDDARALAESLVNAGTALGKRIVALLTRMETPLGAAVGNFFEVEESLALLGCPEALERVPLSPLVEDLSTITLRLTAWMLVLGGVASDLAEAEERCRVALEDGSAWARMKRNIQLQSGDVDALLSRLGAARAPVVGELTSPASGTLTRLDAFAIGMAGVHLGVGRGTAADDVFPDVGFLLQHKPGATVERGTVLARVFGRSEEAVERAIAIAAEGVTIDGDEMQQWKPETMILEEIGGE